jgi:hypothetical protein
MCPKRISNFSALFKSLLVYLIFPVTHSIGATESVGTSSFSGSIDLNAGLDEPDRGTPGSDQHGRKEHVEKKRTCADAKNASLEEEDNIFDCHNAIDFELNGPESWKEYFRLYLESNSFNTSSPNLYFILDGTGASDDQAKEFINTASANDRSVVLNLSNNPGIGDGLLAGVDLRCIVYLNLSHTSITDAGIANLISIIQSGGLNKLICINLSDTKVTPNGVESLRQAMRSAVDSAQITGKLKGKDGVIYSHSSQLHFGEGLQQRHHPDPGSHPSFTTAASGIASVMPNDISTSVEIDPDVDTIGENPEIIAPAIPATHHTQTAEDILKEEGITLGFSGDTAALAEVETGNPVAGDVGRARTARNFGNFQRGGEGNRFHY